MKLLYTALAFVFILLGSGCSTPTVPAVKVEITQAKVDYLTDVKPILDKRCVSCHSCYNSPCQAKFSSYEGVDRGGSKLLVYDALRLKAANPTRLFIDAKDTKEWRNKGFFTLTTSAESNTSYNDSIMMHMLYQKKLHPEVIGDYSPDDDELICPKNKKELNQYVEDKPHHGMPYGFPALEDKQYETLAQWIHRGAKGPTLKEQEALKTPSAKAKIEIKKWEKFFNTQDPKHSVTARYLYEHLFLAHINFTSTPKEFYRLIRSYTPPGYPVEEIPTLRPFDNPIVKHFYYRFEKIHTTIVHKTHMVIRFDDKKLTRIKKQFISPKWIEKPHYIDYDVKMSANPFVAFYQIPAQARYQFLLDNSKYTIMTFIRGPVCRGQMALNVIHDHFWLMFSDPKYDLSLSHPEFIKAQSNNLSMPIETSTKNIFDTFSDNYKKRAKKYYFAKRKLYDKVYPKGLGIDSIWKGESSEDSPLLTVYRHFNSASVHHGVLGKLPRTIWVIDYPQFERIYYSLVAGYDVYGNLAHQTNVRRYMDYLRMEGELNFISYMPKQTRLNIFKSWYINDDDVENRERSIFERGTKVHYTTTHYKNEFVEQVVNNHILKSTNISFDPINYFKKGTLPPKMPKEFNTLEDFHNGARSLTVPGTGFIKNVTDNGINTILVRVKLKDGSDMVRTLVINRWHDNVNSIFNSEQVDPSKDTMDLLPGSIGSYPNVFAIVEQEDLPDFFDMLENYDHTKSYRKKVRKYFIARDEKIFWETYDWFQDAFNKADPVNSGLYDLNRYFKNADQAYPE